MTQDQPWSAQDERQIRGRAHRQPQDKVVKVIHILASDSSDPLMYEVARGKRNMFDAFVNKELGEGSYYFTSCFSRLIYKVRAMYSIARPCSRQRRH